MLNIEEKEKNKIEKLLNQLSSNIDKIDYIKKDNIYYDNKTKEPINDVLTYIFGTFGPISDLHLVLHSPNGNIGIGGRHNGTMFDTKLIISPTDNYSKATYNNINYDTRSLKIIIDSLVADNNDIPVATRDYQEFINIPSFGAYKARHSHAGRDAITRLLPINKKEDENYINYDLLKIDENITYIIKVEVIDGELSHNNRIILNNEVKDKITIYYNSLDKMFQQYKNKINFYQSNRLKIILEYNGDTDIKVSIQDGYYITRDEMDTTVLNYVLDNLNDFYNPVFNSFIEDLTQSKLDPIMGDFQSVDDLKNYLLVLKMQKI